MTVREELAAKKFNCSVKERAIFESGIKLATVYHQFVGTPFNLNTVDDLEKSIEKAISVQPYVSDVRIGIDRSALTSSGDTYSYCSLTGNMIDAVVTIKIDDVSVTSEMRYDEELGYPLMYVSKIQ